MPDEIKETQTSTEIPSPPKPETAPMPPSTEKGTGLEAERKVEETREREAEIRKKLAELERKVRESVLKTADFSQLDQPKIQITEIEEEHNKFVQLVNQKEQEAQERGIPIPTPSELNKEGGDALQVHNPLLLVRHWGNYQAVAATLETLVGKERLETLRVLEIGGGAIFPLWMAQKLGCEYLGSDYQEKIADYAKSVLAGGNFQFLCVDATKMSETLKGQEPFDAIIINECLEHLTDPQLAAFFEGAYQFLKEGGIVIGTVPNRAMHPDKKPSNYPPHVYKYSEYTKGELKDILNRLDRRFSTNLAQMFQIKQILGIVNEEVAKRIRKNFRWERLGNTIFGYILKVFPKGSRQETILDRTMDLLYQASHTFRGGKKKREIIATRVPLQFPEWAKQTKITLINEKTEKNAFGLLFIFQKPPNPLLSPTFQVE